MFHGALSELGVGKNSHFWVRGTKRSRVSTHDLTSHIHWATKKSSLLLSPYNLFEMTKTPSPSSTSAISSLRDHTFQVTLPPLEGSLAISTSGSNYPLPTLNGSTFISRADRLRHLKAILQEAIDLLESEDELFGQGDIINDNDDTPSNSTSISGIWLPSSIVLVLLSSTGCIWYTYILSLYALLFMLTFMLTLSFAASVLGSKVGGNKV